MPEEAIVPGHSVLGEPGFDREKSFNEERGGSKRGRAWFG